jgi:hypothetical protein
MSLIIPANSLAGGGYAVDNSCRFNSGSSDSLTRTLGTPTNNKIWTYSFWVKQCNNAGNLLNTGSDTSYIYFRPSGADPAPYGFSIEQYVGSFQYRIIPNMVFRDHSAWRHIVIAFDTTQATASNRIKLYVNGEQVTSFNTATYPSLNLDTQTNSAVSHKIGGFASGGNLDSYLSAVNFIDGQQLTPTDFGEFDSDTGIWKPIAYTGTYGTNGFFLEFQDSGALGTDTSGEGNNFTVNNLTSIDQTTDTPTNNFCTLNPLSSTTFPTFSEGNTKTVISTSNDDGAISRGNIFVSKGKWYWEVKLIGYSLLSRVEIGVETADSVANNMSAAGLFGTGKARGRRGDANTIRDGNTGVTYSSNLATNDIVGVALDVDSGTLIFYTNGVSQGTAFSDLTNETWGIALGQANSTYEINTGNAPFTITPPGNSDANGYGNFEYAVPPGYYALCTKNLSTKG